MHYTNDGRSKAYMGMHIQVQCRYPTFDWGKLCVVGHQDWMKDFNGAPQSGRSQRRLTPGLAHKANVAQLVIDGVIAVRAAHLEGMTKDLSEDFCWNGMSSQRGE